MAFLYRIINLGVVHVPPVKCHTDTHARGADELAEGAGEEPPRALRPAHADEAVEVKIVVQVFNPESDAVVALVRNAIEALQSEIRYPRYDSDHPVVISCNASNTHYSTRIVNWNTNTNDVYTDVPKSEPLHMIILSLPDINREPIEYTIISEQPLLYTYKGSITAYYGYNKIQIGDNIYNACSISTLYMSEETLETYEFRNSNNDAMYVIENHYYNPSKTNALYHSLIRVIQ